MSSLNTLVLRTSLPIFFGYLALGGAFGVLFSELGYHWLYASAMGLFIYAGAGQFLAVGLLANHAGLFEMAVATFLLNARHLFYGLSFISQIKSRGLPKLYQIFALTDETYSLLTSTPIPKGIDEGKFQVRLTLLNQVYWVMGCTLGAWLGGQFSFSTAGIEFILPALFVVLAIEQYKLLRQPWALWVAFAMGMVALLWISQKHMLIIAIVLSLVVLFVQYARAQASRTEATDD